MPTAPGLIHNRITQRDVAVQAKKRRLDEEYRQRSRPRQQMEEERRVEGLARSIAPDNRGFAMLAKMGYKQGDTIGRNASSASTTALVEPIGIQVKTGRGGFGREAAIQQLNQTKLALRQQRAAASSRTTISTDEFRKRMTQQVQERQMESDLG